MTNPRSDLNLALGLSSCDFPLKLTSFNPPHAFDPLPSSHFNTSYHVRSFTALCIGTMTFISFVWGSWFFLAIAAKNWDSEGYTHLSPSNRGIEEVSRSVERFPGACGGGGGLLPPSVFEEKKRDQGDEGDWWSTGHMSVDDEDGECWEGFLWSTG